MRSGGYFPADLRSMYDVTGHGYDGTGQTIGFTLWGAGERQTAMTAFATATGDQLITVDPPCTGDGSPTTPSSCVTQSVAADHLLSILENGNTNNQFGGNVETALDIEQAHGIATHAAMKYYLADCTASPPAGSGLSNGGNCNGSDVGLEDALEDAANDPTLHSVSNSWAFGGEAEWGLADPFLLASQNSLAIGAAAGTTFYFSTGDSGTYQSGYPSDSPYVVGVGGTTLFSTIVALDAEHRGRVGGRRQLVLEHRRPSLVAERPRRGGQRRVPGPLHPRHLRGRRHELVRPLRGQHERDRRHAVRRRRRHERRRTGAERHGSRDRELHRRADVFRPDAARSASRRP